MDNLTHSLIGAMLGQLGLKKKSGLAMPTVIIAANLPDIDASCVIYGIESLAMRRGITHGPLAMLLLPFLLWAAMLGFDQWQSRRGKRPATRLPVHKGWLLAIAYIGCLSHPLFDWMNVYGIRLLEPFSSTWFYGDTLFIIDLWLWIALGLTMWLSLRQEKRGSGASRRTAWTGFGIICSYILGNGLMTASAEAEAQLQLQEAGHRPALVVASPPPLAFWKRDIFWRGDGIWGRGDYRFGHGVAMDRIVKPSGMDDPRLSAWLANNPKARAFLFWARMPLIEQDERGGAYYLRDQRYHDPMARSRFQVKLSDGDG